METVVIEVPKAFSFEKDGTKIEHADVSALPQVSITRIWEYGFRQILADSYASKHTPEEVAGALLKRNDSIINGVLRANAVGPRADTAVLGKLRGMAKRQGIKTKLSTLLVAREVLGGAMFDLWLGVAEKQLRDEAKILAGVEVPE